MSKLFANVMWLCLVAENVKGLLMGAATAFRRVYYSTCYLLFIFFVIIFKIFLKTLVYINISCIFTP